MVRDLRTVIRLEGVSMTVEKAARDSSGGNTIAVSESAKQQIRTVSATSADLAGRNLGPSFFDGFPDFAPDRIQAQKL
jgi:hypothetical protein